jgi:hypothetical protein
LYLDPASQKLLVNSQLTLSFLIVPGRLRALSQPPKQAPFKLNSTVTICTPQLYDRSKYQEYNIDTPYSIA